MLRRTVLRAAQGRVGDKVAVVTGGAGGIGSAISRTLAREGAKVVVVDVNVDQGEAVARDIGGTFVRCDVTQHAEVCDLFAKVVSDHGRCDLVANNAGVGPVQRPTHTTPIENWHKMIDSNLNSIFYVMREALAQMSKQGSGSLCNMSSVAGISGASTGIPGYTAAKWAVVGLTKSAAVEYGPQGIRINCVCPTTVRTQLVESFIASTEDPVEMERMLSNYNPMPGMPVPEDVAGAFLYLLSDEARWVTGVALPVDGGKTVT
eukprot:TRINITY_DN578_c0_g1_i1.p1 TRINITY_DN578_c0_g1~~TRINITY_DN578_c0_g1_i1.p1  ORF type:complete len:285 (+),score=65.64 TRINITY_DN578_c0_g1_i1:72-857(+)